MTENESKSEKLKLFWYLPAIDVFLELLPLVSLSSLSGAPEGSAASLCIQARKRKKRRMRMVGTHATSIRVVLQEVEGRGQ